MHDRNCNHRSDGPSGRAVYESRASRAWSPDTLYREVMSHDTEQNIAALLQPDEYPINWDENYDESLSLSTYCPDLFQGPVSEPSQGNRAPSDVPCSITVQFRDAPVEATSIYAVTNNQAPLEDPSCHSKLLTANSATELQGPAVDATKQTHSLRRQHSAGKQSRYDDELKLQRNREAQKRFRLRHKVLCLSSPRISL